MPYPSPPAQRMAYDRDGSTVLVLPKDFTASTEASAAQMKALNNESFDLGISGYPGASYLVVIFPEARDLSGIYARNANPYSHGVTEVATSVDTTNGRDGTWVAQIANFADSTSYRQAIAALSVTGVKGIRLKGEVDSIQQPDWAIVHLYGIKSGAGDRLMFWHPTLDQALNGADLDFGDMPRGTVATKTFRLRNQSTAMVATDTVLSTEVLTDANPGLAAQYAFSLDGTTFAASVTIPSIAAGATTGVLHVRRTSPDNAALGPWAVRHNAVPTAFA